MTSFRSPRLLRRRATAVAVTASVRSRKRSRLSGVDVVGEGDGSRPYASVQIARGVPVTAVPAQLGHSKKSLTHDTYSHVLMDD